MQFYQNSTKVTQFSKADKLRGKVKSTGEHSRLSLSGNMKFYLFILILLFICLFKSLFTGGIQK